MPEAEAPIWVWPVVATAIVASAAAVPFLRVRKGRTVFLSYRRADTSDATRRLADSLSGRFGRGRVFFDVQSIGPGENFRRAITRRLRRCDAALIVIGTHWATLRDDRDALRLHQPDDMVRSEVAAALDSGALVIPVTVNGARQPVSGDLPEDLLGLLDLQTMDLGAEVSDRSLSALADAIAASPVRRTPLLALIPHVAVVVLLAVFWQVDGLTPEEFTTSLGIVAPMAAACAAVAVAHALRTEAPARVRQVPVSSLLAPLGFVAIMAVLVVFKALSIWSFPAFKLWLAAVELLFAAYTGGVLAATFENRSPR